MADNAARRSSSSLPAEIGITQRALDRLSRLQRVTAALSEARTPHEVASVVMDQGIAALEARAARVSLVQPAEGHAEVIAAIGFTGVRTRFALDDSLPTNEVLRTGQPLFLLSHEEALARFPSMRGAADFQGALASAPLVVDGRVIGAMTLGFDGPREFADDDRQLLLALATQCAQALERARLYELSLTIQEDLRRSRDQLVAILGGIAEGVTVQDVEGRLIYANDIAANLSGYATADEFMRTYPAVLQRFVMFDEHGQPLPYDQLPGRRLLRGEPSGELVIQFRNQQTGEWRWSILDATPVTDEQGRVQLIVNIFRDITDRKRQTDATAFLAAASTLLGSTLDVATSLGQVAELAVSAIADWCIVELVDGGNHARSVAVAHANPEHAALAQAIRAREPRATAGFERVSYSGRAELIVDTWPAAEEALAADPERRHLFEAIQPTSMLLVPLIARGQTLGFITLATAQAGRRYTQLDLDLAEDLAARAGLAIDNARLFHDAQERAEHQAALNVALRETVEMRDRALADLQQALRTRDEFLASASHDLKNPLASIKATAQLLHRRLERPGAPDMDRLRDGLHRVDTIATRAASLVDELLDLASMQMGRPLRLERKPTDLIALARDVTDEHQAAEGHAVQLESLQSELVGSWDANRLRRALQNLIDNAVKYSPDGGQIVVRVRPEAEWAVIDVIDQGIGIPERDLARIFERFQRASNVEGRIGGTGIGLASARHILESHGGTIAVTSQEGDGSTFTLRLPINQ